VLVVIGSLTIKIITMFVEANNPTACPINPTLIDPRCVVRNPLRAQRWTTEDNKSPPAAP
jgi:hypothetical protein